MRRNVLSLAAAGLLVAAACLTAAERGGRAGAEKPPAPDAQGSLRFLAADGGEFHFDTGVLRGVLRAGGRSLGLSSLIHIPSGKPVSRSFGVVSHYRVFSSKVRYGPAAWDLPSETELREDGSLRARWPAAEARPFDLQVTYRWSAPATLDVETAVIARSELPDFESFLASYFAEPFTTSMVYVKAQPGAGGKPGFLPAEDSNGPWQMFPRDDRAVKVIQDGRWTIPPNPVNWTIMPALAQPLAVRRDQESGITAVLMAPARDCFAVSTPQRSDRHYSTYLSLFGRTIKAGETARARARLVIAASPSEEQVLQLYRAYLQDLRRQR